MELHLHPQEQIQHSDIERICKHQNQLKLISMLQKPD